ncbi:hypothetical protein ACN6MY_07770 [Peribacillus sp. B-H-3]|uniref:UPF0738 family protein n=1 Tax=Peribacillus sp. B-H-3 TaxID=3400420 RepID=UPI003B013A38
MMRKTIMVQDAKISDGTLLLFADETANLTSLHPKEQMLVDSDHFAFIYLTETDEGYTYISLHEGVWAPLKSAWEKKMPAVVKAGDNTLELKGIYEELEYLIDNIKGNSNYGEEFSGKVEKTFAI